MGVGSVGVQHVFAEMHMLFNASRTITLDAKHTWQQPAVQLRWCASGSCTAPAAAAAHAAAGLHAGQAPRP